MKRTICFLVSAVMLLSILCGCGEAGKGNKTDATTAVEKNNINITADILPDKESVIGSDGDEITVTVPSGIFENATSVSISTADITAESGVTLLSPVYEIKEKNDIHNLGGSVSVRINMAENTEYKEFTTLMGAYYDGSKWEYIEPDFSSLESGYIMFDTPHFSPFVAAKVSKEKAIDEYSKKLAVQSIADKQEEKAVLDAIKDSFNETFDAMGFTDKTVQGVLMQSIAKETDFGSFIVAAKTGNLADFSGKAAELIAKATLKNMWNEKFRDKVTGVVGSVSSGVVAGIEKVYDGDYSEAYKAFVSSAAEYFPAVRAIKATYAAAQVGREAWVNYSIECGYKLYLNENPSADGKLEGEGSADVWREIYSLMSSSMRLMVDDYKKMYAAANEMTVAQVDADSSLCSKIEATVEENLKRLYIQRYKSKKEIGAEEKRIKKQIEQFEYYGLLDYDYFGGWSSSMTISDRLKQLYKIRENIIELAGGDISVFGGNRELQNEALAVAISQWISCGNDRGAFIKWLEGEGYIKKPEKPAEKFAWVRVGDGEQRCFYDHQEGGDYYDDYTMNGGSFTVVSKYKCKECAACGKKGGHTRTASASVTNPPDTLYDGEVLTLSMTLEANASDCRLGVQNIGFEARFNGVGFADKDGEVHFSTDALNGVTKVSKQLSATISAGTNEGDTAEFKYVHLGGREYVYTYAWTKIG